MLTQLAAAIAKVPIAKGLPNPDPNPNPNPRKYKKTVCRRETAGCCSSLNSIVATTGALKMQDMKMKDQVARHENAGHENAGQENAGHENVFATLFL